MSGRYQQLYRVPSNFYLKDCPVIIEAGALLKDTVTGRIISQLKIRNLSDKKIIACKVSIRAFDITGKELEGINDYSYLDLDIDKEDNFGSQTPIYMPDDYTRSIIPCVDQVVFEHELTWDSPGGKWNSVDQHKRRPISDLISDVDLRSQFFLEVGYDAQYAPETYEGLFLCSCGSINLESSPCWNCGKSLEEIKSLSSDDYLSKALRIRLEHERVEKEIREMEEQAEEELRKEAERKKEQEAVERKAELRKTIKSMAITAGIIIVLCLIIFAAYSLIQYHKEQKEQWVRNQLMENEWCVFDSDNIPESRWSFVDSDSAYYYSQFNQVTGEWSYLVFERSWKITNVSKDKIELEIGTRHFTAEIESNDSIKSIKDNNYEYERISEEELNEICSNVKKKKDENNSILKKLSSSIQNVTEKDLDKITDEKEREKVKNIVEYYKEYCGTFECEGGKTFISDFKYKNGKIEWIFKDLNLNAFREDSSYPFRVSVNDQNYYFFDKDSTVDTSLKSVTDYKGSDDHIQGMVKFAEGVITYTEGFYATTTTVGTEIHKEDYQELNRVLFTRHNDDGLTDV